MRFFASWRRPGAANDADAVYVTERFGVRSLHIGSDTIQSSMRIARPNDLELAYTRSMMAFLLFNERPARLLMIGLGGGSLAKFVYHRMPQTATEVAEISPQVVAIARRLFQVPAADERLTVRVCDGAEFVAREGPGTHRIAGFIDFGDMVHSALVADLAVTCPYAMLGKDEPVVVGRRESHDRVPAVERYRSTSHAAASMRPGIPRASSSCAAGSRPSGPTPPHWRPPRRFSRGSSPPSPPVPTTSRLLRARTSSPRFPWYRRHARTPSIPTCSRRSRRSRRARSARERSRAPGTAAPTIPPLRGISASSVGTPTA